MEKYVDEFGYIYPESGNGLTKIENACICSYCLQALKSHGERVHAIEHYNGDEEIPVLCDFCDDEMASEIYELI